MSVELTPKARGECTVMGRLESSAKSGEEQRDAKLSRTHGTRVGGVQHGSASVLGDDVEMRAD